MVRKVLRKVSATLVFILALLLTIIMIVLNVATNLYGQMITVFLQGSSYEIKGGDNPQYFESEFSSEDDMVQYAQELCERIVAEGMVLLKNENHALPLATGGRVSLLSSNSVDLVYGGTGAGSIDTSKAPNLKGALEAAGFEVNQTLWDFYDVGAGSSYRRQVPSVTGAGVFQMHEVPMDVYTDDVKASFEEYHDAAIVVIARAGGESADLTAGLNGDGHYLELSQEEKDLLALANENFDNVIVLLNTVNPMELGFLADYNVDACLWIGALGQEGAYAVGKALSGEVNPSGRLVDTYAYDVYSAPAMSNFGDYTITNSEVKSGNKYMVYAEGIYVGYRYYETRYEDVALGNETEANYNYEEVVQYPFGYGLSYTDFAWSNYTVREQGDHFEIAVDITNNGDVAGKEVVQIYMQSPYTDYDRENKIEKSAVELVGFNKTAVLQPGETETVTVDVSKELMKTYDALGYGTYIVDAGDYYFTAARNAHEAVNQILVNKGVNPSDNMSSYSQNLAWTYTQDELDSITYATAIDTGYAITNQFKEADISYYDNGFEYLSRSDWEGTWPTTYADGQMMASEELITNMEISLETDANETAPIYDTVSDEYGKLNLIDLKDVSYDDPKWEALLNQMPQDEIFNLVRQGGYATILLQSINAPSTLDKDGPAGISSTLAGGGISCMAYPPEVILASSYNTDLAEEMGKMVGEDSINSGVSMWYAPAMNIHRAAFSGRNFEYYSEDGFLSGKMGAAEVAGFQEKGGMVTIKHYAVNDQETNRIGGAMFANEQSIREIYLKGFEISVREADANGVMTSMNRIGARWSGGHAGLMTEVLRNEWGFNGFAITDQTSFPGFEYCDLIEGTEAGTDLWLNTSTYLWQLDKDELTGAVQQNIRTAAHNVLYTIANSNAMNGIDKDSVVKNTTPGWKMIRVIVDIVMLIIIVALYYASIRLFKKKRVKVK